jgi:hypothetical protein
VPIWNPPPSGSPSGSSAPYPQTHTLTADYVVPADSGIVFVNSFTMANNTSLTIPMGSAVQVIR